MSRIQACFARLLAEDRKALIPYIMTGDPHPEVTVPLMHAMVKAGANIIELGAPFSDPMADGPVIQAAAERALEFHVTLDDVFSAVEKFRKLDDVTPIIMMGYLNQPEETAEVLATLARLLGGRTLGLFTSLRRMRDVGELLSERLRGTHRLTQRGVLIEAPAAHAQNPVHIHEVGSQTE